MIEITKFKTINILGLEYKIEEVEQVDKNQRLFGEIDYVNQIIKVEKDLTTDKKIEVLIHEIIHGIFEALSFEEENKNEHLTQALACSLYQILKSNNVSV